jgi:hypothetical protein
MVSSSFKPATAKIAKQFHEVSPKRNMNCDPLWLSAPSGEFKHTKFKPTIV